MELSPEFHGTLWTTFEQHMWFHGIPWNLSNKTSSFMEFPGILSRSKVPWHFMELFPYSRVPWNSVEFHGTFNFPQKNSMAFPGIPWNFVEVPWNSMEFHGAWWISYLKKIRFLNIVFGIWLIIRCYLAKISQKRYILHWFQYCNSFFEHPSVSENGARSAKWRAVLSIPKLQRCNRWSLGIHK